MTAKYLKVDLNVVDARCAEVMQKAEEYIQREIPTITAEHKRELLADIGKKSKTFYTSLYRAFEMAKLITNSRLGNR